MSSANAIAVRELTKRYRLFGRKSQLQTLKSALLKREVVHTAESSITAIRDLSFEVARGESFALVGRNGSGKSTLLKLISGILKPTAGSIEVDGRVSALIELGAGFHPEISGRENIFINGIMLGLTRREIEKRFDRIVDFAGVGQFLEQPVKTYSSGMYVRLGFAVAVHVDPDILLIDEVLSVGDEEFSQKCVAKIQEMKYRGVTMIFVTHQLQLVRDLCDRALWLDQGAMAGLGDPVRVVDAYLQNVAGGAATPVLLDEAPAPERVEDDEEETADDNALEEEERWGSGEALLHHVALTDDRGRDLVALGGTSAVTVELDVNVRVPQEDFVFGIGIYHADGTCVYGTNTDLEGWISQKLESDCKVRFVMPSLELVAGSYRVDAAIHTKNGRAFDYRRGVLRFVVGARVHDIGVYRPRHTWEFEGGVSVQRVEDIHRNVPAVIAETLREMESEEKKKFRKRRKKTDAQ